MKERPILFSGPMVRAILSGQKTQTRRVMKTVITMGHESFLAPRNGKRDAPTFLLPEHLNEVAAYCPHGTPGDKLWARETWTQVPRQIPHTAEDLPMRSDDHIVVYRADARWNGVRLFAGADRCVRWAKPGRWKPSIHMPRIFSRILLDITNVRAQRLQSISEADAKAEGAKPMHFDHGSAADRGHIYMPCMEPENPYRNGFAHLWEQINGKGSWAANPFVWALTFNRVEVPA